MVDGDGTERAPRKAIGARPTPPRKMRKTTVERIWSISHSQMLALVSGASLSKFLSRSFFAQWRLYYYRQEPAGVSPRKPRGPLPLPQPRKNAAFVKQRNALAACERRGNNLQREQGFDLKAKARIWPGLSYVPRQRMAVGFREARLAVMPWTLTPEHETPNPKP